MIDKVINGIINFTIGMTLNLSGDFLIDANSILGLCGKLAGLIFTIVGIFYMYQAYRHKKEQRYKNQKRE